MAVQAQHPSNILLLNRVVEERKNLFGNDFSLQPQLGGGGGFLDQSPMLLNNGVASNSRKRERLATAATPTMKQIDSKQAHPQLVNMTQLRMPQPNVISNGLRLAFADQQQQELQKQRQQRQETLLTQSSVLSSLLSQDLSNQFKQQKDEIEHFLKAQGEELRRTIGDKRKRHYSSLLGAAEESVAKRLKKKDEEVEEAKRQNAELESRAEQLSVEVHAWQARARAQEATAATLQAQLQQAMMTNVGWRALQQDREDGSGPGCSVGDAEDAESAYIDPYRVAVSTGPRCKACRKRVASVVLLPCRHLCLCAQCDAVAQVHCPLCLTLRSNSLEVFL